jgi:hypothetical protein
MKTTRKAISERQRKAARKAWKTIRERERYIERAQAALDAWETIREDERN